MFITMSFLSVYFILTFLPLRCEPSQYLAYIYTGMSFTYYKKYKNYIKYKNKTNHLLV